jgi:hypothetical protein
VLAGVDDLELEAVGTGLQGAHDRRDLHEIGTRAGDEVDQRTGHNHSKIMKGGIMQRKNRKIS